MFTFKKWFLIGFLPLLLLINSCNLDEGGGDVLNPRSDGLRLNPSEVTLEIAGTTNITVTLNGEEVTNQVTWSSGDTDIATVSDGTVTGVGPGTTTITATNGEYSASAKVTVKGVSVTGISLSPQQAIITNTTTPGSIKLSYSITPTNASDQEVTWKSTDPSVATASDDGTVTGVGPGTTTITATAGGVSDSAEITVFQSVTNITFTDNEVVLHTNNTTTLTYTILPDNASDKGVTWTSSKTNIATVADDGTVTGIAKGETTITVTAINGGGTSYSDSATIRVSEFVTNVTGISFSVTTATLTIGGTTNLEPTITPADASDKRIIWASENTGIATVDNGTVTGIATGTTIITATTVDGSHSASATITVFQPVTNITLSPSGTLAVGGTNILDYIIFPTNASDQGVTWTSSKTNVATVADDGTITGKTNGETTITVTATNGGGRSYSDSVTIEVSDFFTNVTDITLSATNAILAIGKTATLTYTITPADASDPGVIWTSRNANIAEVADDGTVTGIAEGETTITVIATNGGRTSYSDSATITVLANVIHVATITLSPSTATLTNGGSTNLTVTITPTNANEQGVTWSNSDPNVATVDSDGKVTGVYPGVTTITVTATDGGLTATSTVTVLPDPPQNLGEVVRTSCDKNTTVALKWDESDGATSYQLVYGTTTTNLTTNSYTATGLTPNTEYEFQVKACFGSACSAPSSLPITTEQSHLGVIIAAGSIPNDLNRTNLQYDNPSRDIFSLYKSGAKVELRYLTPSGAGDQSGTSRANASKNPVKVMNEITDASEDTVYLVLLAGGTYERHALALSGFHESIKMKEHVAIIGGMDLDKPVECLDFSDTETIIRGHGILLSSKPPYKVYPAFLSEDVNETALLYRVTIFNMYNNSGYTGTGLGGGMYNTNSSPTLIGVTFSENKANHGGGMYNDNSSPTLIGVTFSKNTFPGSGMHNKNSSPLLIGVTFSENGPDGATYFNGPGMYNENSSPILIGNTFYGNDGDTDSGIYNDNNGGPGPTIVNSILIRAGGKPSIMLDTAIEVSETEKLKIYNSYMQEGISSEIPNGTKYGSISLATGSDIDFSLKDGYILIDYGSIYDETDGSININSQLTVEGGVKIHPISSGVGVNKGLFVKMRGSSKSPTLYYSQDGNNWYTTPSLSGTVAATTANLPTDVIDLTKYDATGYERTDRPDLGAYEAR